jgi:hypothetical protein
MAFFVEKAIKTTIIGLLSEFPKPDFWNSPNYFFRVVDYYDGKYL